MVHHHVCFAVVAAGHQLSNLWKASASLHTLVAGGNYLGDRGLAALCGAFCYLDPARVVSLDVSKNGKFCRLLRVCVCVCLHRAWLTCMERRSSAICILRFRGGVGGVTKDIPRRDLQGLIGKCGILLYEWACRGAEDSVMTTRESPATLDQNHVCSALLIVDVLP